MNTTATSRNRSAALGRSMPSLLMGFGLAALALAPHAAPENPGTTQQPLGVDKNVTLWTTRGNRIPVCWITPGFEREKRIVRQAVLDTWEYYADLSFTGWDDCPAQGDAQLVRVRINNHDATDAGAGGSAALGTNALSQAGLAANVNLGFNPDGSADKQRVEYIGVHEFGHVLGFEHEQDLPGNVEGPAHCDQTAGIDPNGVPVTAFDRNSVMNYCNADGNGQGRLTDIDILGVRAVYGTRTHFAPSAVILLGNGQIWRSTGRRCDDASCPGWELVDNDGRIKAIAASESRLFGRERTGQIWVWDGHTACTDKACSGWTLIDSNTRSSQIVASANTLFQLQVDGKVWRWDGRTTCSATACPGWTLVDNDPRIKTIAASSTRLFARQGTGELWVWDGRTPCTASACAGWTLIDANKRSRQIAAGGDTLFQLHVDGNLWRWDGRTACNAQGCPGWSLIDREARTVDMQAFVPVSAPSRLSSGTLF